MVFHRRYGYYNTIGVKVLILKSLGSVSYTHLDVYKRQLIILQDCLRATSYNYKGFSFFSLFPKKIELHHSNVVCRRTAHSFHCAVKKFVVLHLVKDFQLFWIYVMAVCHLA